MCNSTNPKLNEVNTKMPFNVMLKEKIFKTNYWNIQYIDSIYKCFIKPSLIKLPTHEGLQGGFTYYNSK